MNVLYGIIFIVFILASQNTSALTISILGQQPSSVVFSKILKEIYKRAEIPLEFVTLPTERSLAQSTRGLIDGELVRIYKTGEQNPTLIRVPTPYTFFESRAFSSSQDIQKDIHQNGLSALQDYRIGVIRGMKYADTDLKDFKNLEFVDSPEQLFKMLVRDRIDVVMSTRVTGLTLIKEHNLQSVHLLEPVFQTHDLYHYLHEKNKRYVPILDETIRKMKESGELAELKDKFVNELLESE